MNLDSSELVVVGGLLLGALVGATIQRTNYCLMGAVADFGLSGSACTRELSVDSCSLL